LNHPIGLRIGAEWAPLTISSIAIPEMYAPHLGVRVALGLPTPIVPAESERCFFASEEANQGLRYCPGLLRLVGESGAPMATQAHKPAKAQAVGNRTVAFA